MADWNFDISQAPKSQYVTTTRTVRDRDITTRALHAVKIIAATNCGKVITTWWLPENGNDGNRWNFFCKGENPIAWMPYPIHPNLMEDV